MDSGKYLEVFAVGMLLALYYTLLTKTPQGETSRRLLQRLSPWLWLLGLILLGCAALRNCVNATWCYGAVPPTTFAFYPNWALEFAIALGFGLCLLAILFNAGWLKRFFSWTPLRWVGLVSFSLYLWQLIFINFINAGFGPYLMSHFSKPIVACIFPIAQWAVILSGSFILYVMVERPNMHVSDRLRKKMLARETQKAAVPPLEINTRDESFADEETEPRQPVVLAPGDRRKQETKLVP